MSDAQRLASVEDVDELPDDLRAKVYDKVATTLEAVNDVLADLDAADVPEGRLVSAESPTDDVERCFHPDCNRRATAVYEGTVPPAEVVRRKACWIHGAKATAVRYLDTEANHARGDR